MKKRILPVAVLLIVALAVFLPQLLYYYSDTSYLNQVKYSDKDTGSVNLEMASTAKTKTIDQKLEDLNSIITDKEYAKKKVEVLFDPSENELKTIRKNVKKQINYWLELFGCKELIYNKKTIKKQLLCCITNNTNIRVINKINNAIFCSFFFRLFK